MTADGRLPILPLLFSVQLTIPSVLSYVAVSNVRLCALNMCAPMWIAVIQEGVQLCESKKALNICQKHVHKLKFVGSKN